MNEEMPENPDWLATEPSRRRPVGSGYLDDLVPTLRPVVSSDIIEVVLMSSADPFFLREGDEDTTLAPLPTLRLRDPLSRSLSATDSVMSGN